MINPYMCPQSTIDNAISSFSAYAEYILMAPSEVYQPFMDVMREKIHMSKVVIEFLQNNQDATYEDLLNKIQVGFKHADRHTLVKSP